MRHGSCNAVECRAKVLDTEVFCQRHLNMLESDVKRVLGRTFRPNKKHQSAVFLDTLALAQRDIIYYQTSGHLPPRDRPFDWDDDREVGRGTF